LKEGPAASAEAIWTVEPVRNAAAVKERKFDNNLWIQGP